MLLFAGIENLVKCYLLDKSYLARGMVNFVVCPDGGGELSRRPALILFNILQRSISSTQKAHYVNEFILNFEI